MILGNGSNLTLILLITTIVVFDLFYSSIKSLLLGTKCVFKHQDLQKFGFKLNKYEYFQALGVVDRGSETQPQLLENLNKLT